MDNTEFTASMVEPLRKKMKLTQAQFADKINAGARSVARWEAGKMVKISAAVRANMIKLHKKWMVS